MDAVQLFLELVRVAVCGKEPEESLKQACTPEALEAAYSIGADHDLAHLVGQGASKLQLPDSEPLQKCRNAAMAALLRQTRQAVALQKACSLLEAVEIPFIPLKGSVLRQWYPEPWMRTGCDIDILVREDQLQTARAQLEEVGWTYMGRSSHDVSLRSPEGVHLELHFTTIEDCISEKGKTVMDGIWRDAMPVEGKTYQMALSDGLFYFYHVAHMAKHLTTGGCGVRSFLDVWVLNHRVEFSAWQREQLLEKGGLTAFARGAEKLAEIWFSGQSMDERSKLLEDFVLRGGTYGTLENQVQLQQTKKGGKLRFLWERIFQPYAILKHTYPVLQKHKWLTPVFWVVRWFRLLTHGKATGSVQELKTSNNVTEADRDAANALLRYLEL